MGEPAHTRSTPVQHLPNMLHNRSLPIRTASWLTELAFRFCQTVMRSQRFPLVSRAKQPATLEQRDHFGNEDLQHRRQHGRHDVEAICRAIVEPFFHKIGDLLWRAYAGVMPACTSE